jgi:hypothetical protein
LYLARFEVRAALNDDAAVIKTVKSGTVTY